MKIYPFALWSWQYIQSGESIVTEELYWTDFFLKTLLVKKLLSKWIQIIKKHNKNQTQTQLIYKICKNRRNSKTFDFRE